MKSVSLAGLIVSLSVTVVPSFSVNATAASYPVPGDLGTYDSGISHSCLISSLGNVKCTGENSRGELSGEITPLQDFVTVPLPERAIYIAALNQTTCAILEPGSVYCWGDNRYGQVNGRTVSDAERNPTRVIGLPASVTKVALTERSGLALTTEGELWSWGGIGTVQAPYYLGRNGSLQPEKVTSFGGPLRDFTTSTDNVCGLLRIGVTKCFGMNWTYNIGYKQLPTQNTGNFAPRSHKSQTPYPAEDLPTSGVSLETVGSLICATMTDRSVWCWGETFSPWDYRLTVPSIVSSTYASGIFQKPIQLFTSQDEARVLRTHGGDTGTAYCLLVAE